MISKPIIIFFLKKYVGSFLPTTKLLPFYCIIPANILNNKCGPGTESGAEVVAGKKKKGRQFPILMEVTVEGKRIV